MKLSDRDECGSTLPLMIGLLAVLLFLSGSIVNLSYLYLQQRALYQVADSAVLSALTRLDQERYYREGAESVVPTSDELAIIERVVSTSSLGRAAIEGVDRANGSLEVRLALQVPLPWPLLVDNVVVRARARATAAVLEGR